MTRPSTHHDADRRPTLRLVPLLLALALPACGEPDPPSVDEAEDPMSAPDAAGTDPGPDPGGDAGDADALGIAAPSTRPADVAGTTDTAEAPLPPLPTPAVVPPSRVAPVDCASTLPCRFVTADGGLAATLTAADGAALDGSGPLRVDVVLETLSRDARLTIDASSSVVTGGQVLGVETLHLGLASAPGGRDEASFDLVAGVPINGYVTFGGELVGNPDALERVTLRLTEAGTTLSATFADVPLGPAPSAPVDCAASLPCLWRSSDGTTTIALTDAAPARWNRATRLVVTWSLATTRPLEITLSGPGRVTGGDGEALEPYGVELDGIASSDGTPLIRALAADESVVGRVVPRRVPESEAALRRVEIDVVERRAPRTPRWRPVFLDVPRRPAAP